MTADLRGSEIVVTFDDHPGTWRCGNLTAETRARIQELEGVTLGITTAINPHDLTRHDQFARLFHSGEVVLGWIPLVGAAPPPLRPMPPRTS